MGWLQERRRKKLLEEPFPEAWEDILRQSVSHVADLAAEESDRLRDFIRIFVAEKHFEGCGGFEVTDEVRVTIAAQAGLLVLGLPHQYFKNVETILV